MVFAVWTKGVTGRGMHWPWIRGVMEEVARSGQTKVCLRESKDWFLLVGWMWRWMWRWRCGYTSNQGDLGGLW